MQVRRSDDPAAFYNSLVAELSRRLAETLGESRQQMLSLLSEEQDKTILIQALETIASSWDPSFAPAVEKVLLSNEAVEVLQTAATALGKLGRKDCFPDTCSSSQA